MKPQERRADAGNALGLDQRRGFQTPPQTGPEVVAFAQSRNRQQIVFERPTLKHAQPPGGVPLLFAEPFQRQFERGDQTGRRAFHGHRRYGVRG